MVSTSHDIIAEGEESKEKHGNAVPPSKISLQTLKEGNVRLHGGLGSSSLSVKVACRGRAFPLDSNPALQFPVGSTSHTPALISHDPDRELLERCLCNLSFSFFPLGMIFSFMLLFPDTRDDSSSEQCMLGQIQ